jgi:hypothetical protein
MFLGLPQLADIEHSERLLHLEIRSTEAHILHLVQQQLFDTLFYSPVSVAELMLENAYAPWKDVPNSLILLRNLCAFYALTIQFVGASNELGGLDLHLILMWMAVESVRVAENKSTRAPVVSNDVPAALRQIPALTRDGARMVKHLASAVTSDTGAKHRVLPHLQRARSHPLCGLYLHSNVVDELTDRV